MKRSCAVSVIAFVLSVAAGSAFAAEPVKVGVIGTMSGPYALFGQNFKRGIEAWVAQNGSKVGDIPVEFICSTSSPVRQI